MKSIVGILVLIGLVGLVVTQDDLPTTTLSTVDETDLENSTYPTSSTTPSEVTESEYDDDETEECSNDLSSFVREYNFSSLLPDDYFELYENMKSENIYSPMPDLNSTFELIPRFTAFVEKIRENKDLSNSVRYIGHVLSDRIFEANISPQCQADMLHVLNGIYDSQVWAMSIPDSWGSLHLSGVLSGHISSFGEFDQCIKIKSPPMTSPDDETQTRHIYGRYCQAQLRLNLPNSSSYQKSWEEDFRKLEFYKQALGLFPQFPVEEINLIKVIQQGVSALKRNVGHYGFCVPHTCSTDDMQKIFNSFVYPLLKIPVAVESSLCTDHEEVAKAGLDSFQKFAIALLSFLTVLVTLCTLYHIYLIKFVDPKREQEKNNNEKSLQESKFVPERTLAEKFILAFSILVNGGSIFGKNDRLAIVDSVRFFLTIGVFAVQTFNFGSMFTLQILRNQRNSVPFQILLEDRYGPMRVPGMWIDGFVFTMGFTLYLSQSSRLKKTGGEFSFVTYLFKRWFRLSAALLGTFAVFYLYPLTGDGPLWFINERWVVAPCKKTSSIISSFLYYSNWNAALHNYETDGSFPICNPPTWFLSCSTQMYLFLPIIFIPLYRWPKFGLSILIGLLILSPLSTTSPTWALGLRTYYDLFDVVDVQHVLRKFLNFHISPFQYVTSVCIGILTGWLLRNRPNIQIIGGKLTENILWVASFVGIFCSFYSNTHFWQLDVEYPAWQSLTWVVVVKFVWPSSLAYIVFMCASGRSPRMNRILSVKTLQPLAKLSYSIYLLRVPIIFYRYTSKRHTYSLNYGQVWEGIALDYLYTSILAFFLYCLFEGPSIQLIRIFESGDISKLLDAKHKRSFKLPPNSDVTLKVENDKQPTKEYFNFNGTDDRKE